MPESSPVKRACDACHRRKVKCIGDGTKPCRNCNQATLKCTYNAVPQKKGPKGCRAKVISELRENQRQSQLAIKVGDRFSFAGSPTSPLSPNGSMSLPTELVDSCVEYFFSHMYPTQPILNRERLRHTIATVESSPESYCLVAALCAYMMIQPNMQLPANFSPISESEFSSNISLGTALLEDALQVRKTYNYFENPTTDALITSFFFFGCNFCLEKQNTAWIYLREASTLALLLNMDREQSYKFDNPTEALITESVIKRRLYWLLFVTERAYAMQKSRPLTLHATIDTPNINEDPNETVELMGFNHLIKLYKPFDDTFVGLWNQSIEGCESELIRKLESQLADALPTYLRSTETQAVDLKTSQQWLRTMVWQLAISHHLLTHSGIDNSMTFRYPIELSRTLIQDAKDFTQAAMEVHGIGLTKKLFDVACTLVDVMTCVPVEAQHFEVGPRDYLNQFLHLISRLRGGQDRYLPLLLSKINDTLPGMTGSPGRMLSSSLDGPFDDLHDSSTGLSHSQHGSPFGSPNEHSSLKIEYADLIGTPTFSGGPVSPYLDPSSTPGQHFSPPAGPFPG